MNYYYSDEEFKVASRNPKRRRLNPLGEDVYLCPTCGHVTRDEDKIVKAQRIFIHNYYKPGGPWERKTSEKYVHGLGEEVEGTGTTQLGDRTVTE